MVLSKELECHRAFRANSLRLKRDRRITYFLVGEICLPKYQVEEIEQRGASNGQALRAIRHAITDKQVHHMVLRPRNWNDLVDIPMSAVLDATG